MTLRSLAVFVCAVLWLTPSFPVRAQEVAPSPPDSAAPTAAPTSAAEGETALTAIQPEPQPATVVQPMPPSPIEPTVKPAQPAPIASYEDILTAVAADLGKDAPYADRLEAVWKLLKPFAAPESPAPKNKKLDALDRFLKEFPKSNRHDVYAQKMRFAAASDGVVREGGTGNRPPNFGCEFTPKELRTRWEAFSFTLGPGLMSSFISLTLFTLRWEHFYWEIFRGSFMPPGVIAGALGGHGGMGIGVPFHRGDEGRRETRLGVGVEGGGVIGELWSKRDEGYFYASGLFLVPELSFHRRNTRGVAFVTTIRVDLGPFGMKEKEIEDDPDTPEFEPDDPDAGESYFFYANAALLFGVAY